MDHKYMHDIKVDKEVVTFALVTRSERPKGANDKKFIMH